MKNVCCLYYILFDYIRQTGGWEWPEVSSSSELALPCIGQKLTSLLIKGQFEENFVFCQQGNVAVCFKQGHFLPIVLYHTGCEVFAERMLDAICCFIALYVTGNLV